MWPNTFSWEYFGIIRRVIIPRSANVPIFNKNLILGKMHILLCFTKPRYFVIDRKSHKIQSWDYWEKVGNVFNWSTRKSILSRYTIHRHTAHTSFFQNDERYELTIMHDSYHTIHIMYNVSAIAQKKSLRAMNGKGLKAININDLIYKIEESKLGFITEN